MHGGVKLANPLRVSAILSAIRAPAGIHRPVAVAICCHIQSCLSFCQICARENGRASVTTYDPFVSSVRSGVRDLPTLYPYPHRLRGIFWLPPQILRGMQRGIQSPQSSKISNNSYICREKVVPRSGLDSNHLFEELDRWTEVLKHLKPATANDEVASPPARKARATRSPRARKVKRAGGGA
jgi:hypothetical protein